MWQFIKMQKRTVSGWLLGVSLLLTTVSVETTHPLGFARDQCYRHTRSMPGVCPRAILGRHQIRACTINLRTPFITESELIIRLEQPTEPSTQQSRNLSRYVENVDVSVQAFDDLNVTQWRQRRVRLVSNLFQAFIDVFATLSGIGIPLVQL
ncbi:hypothetical protein EV401DRAFT_1548093 [Pisolithus croceorrhizus]|nr:hypothetical protein EV401DRAFT_1548093 [Pisolithus croceorrhizus]